MRSSSGVKGSVGEKISLIAAEYVGDVPTRSPTVCGDTTDTPAISADGPTGHQRRRAGRVRVVACRQPRAAQHALRADGQRRQVQPRDGTHHRRIHHLLDLVPQLRRVGPDRRPRRRAHAVRCCRPCSRRWAEQAVRGY